MVCVARVVTGLLYEGGDAELNTCEQPDCEYDESGRIATDGLATRADFGCVSWTTIPKEAK